MAKKKILSEEEGFNHDYIDRLNDQMEQRESGLKEIPLKKIRIKENVRTQYEKIEEMANSIKEKGLVQPITVTPCDDGFYDIVFGHRRYKGYCHLNKKTPGKYLKILAIVKEMDSFDKDEIKEVQLIENIQRDNLKPLELKNALEDLRERGYSNKEIAKKLGKGEGFIKNTFSSFKTINKNEEIESLMKSNAGVTLSDIQEVKVLPFKEQLYLLQQKAEGIITSKERLRQKVWEYKESNSRKSKEDRVAREAQGCFVLSKSSIKIKPSAIDKADEEQRKELLTTLKELVQKVEESFK